jgi:hypothetical protein
LQQLLKRKAMEKAKVIKQWVAQGGYRRRTIHEAREFARVMGYSESYVAYKAHQICYAREVVKRESIKPSGELYDEAPEFKHDIEADIKHVDVNQLYENFKRFHG